MIDGKTPTAKAMHDEQGYRSFEVLPDRDGLADFDRIVPHYFQSLDRKMQFLNDQGFVPMLETIRRDVAPPWKAVLQLQRIVCAIRGVYGGALWRVQPHLQQGAFRYLPEELLPSPARNSTRR